MVVGIVVAEHTEFAPLAARMTQVQIQTLGQTEYHSGLIEGVQVVLAKCGVGRANAAKAASVLCAVYTSKYIINSGSAGGLADGIDIGDVVAAEKLVYGDVDNRCFGYEYGQVPGMPAAYECSETLLSKFCEVGADHHRCHRGLIASVESFVESDAQKQTIKQFFPEVLAVEMEGCAVAQVAADFAVPCLVVRAISDTASNHTDYETFAAMAGARSAAVICKLLAAL